MPKPLCHSFDDVALLRERSFFVWRAAVPEHELRKIRTYVADIPLPARLLCGGAGIQPNLAATAARLHGDSASSAATAAVRFWPRRVGLPCITSGAADDPGLAPTECSFR